MANIQYIGARYVPKFYENSLDPTSMEWESGHGYEALVVVTYNSDTYTSKIPVPSNIGNPASNPTYWAKTGDYNAAITALQNRMSDIENAVGDVDNLTTTSHEVVGAINEVNNTAINAKTTADILASKKMVVLTDSFGITPSMADNFLVKLKGFLGLSNADFISSAEGGAGYVNPSPNNKTFDDLLNEVSSGMSDSDKSKVTTFVVVGGVNDTRVDMNIDTYRPAVKALFNSAHSLFPNAKMIAAYNATLFHQDFAAARRALKMPFSTQTAAKAGEAGAAFLPLNVIMSAYGATGSDGIHPSSAGSDVIAMSIINIMNGGGTLEIANSWIKTPISFIGGTLNSKFQLVNGSVLYDNAGTPLNISWLFTQLGTETGIPYPTSNDTVIFRPFCLKITHADSTVDYKFDALLKFRNDGIYELSIPSGSNNVIKIENFAAAAYAQINTITDL